MCMHRILMEDDVKPHRDAQRRLNPAMKEVVRNEILKLLDVGVIFPISDSKWVSPIHVVPKKSGITVVKNASDEMVPMRVQTGCALITESSIPLHERTTSLFLLLIRCWSDWQGIATTVS